jgi:signal transduction histidine kinase
MAVRTLRRDKSLSPLAAEALGMIQRNIQLEAHLVDDLLDVTRISRGKLELVCDQMDLLEALSAAVEIARPDFEAKAQRIIVSQTPGDYRVVGDTKRLQQVFWNLLKNASKFSPNGSEIHLRSRSEPVSESAPPRIVVEVADKGIGFDPESTERIFRAFEQANQTVTREFGGLGLGLAISQASVVAHGGTIRAESPGPDQGATFIVELPVETSI